MSPAFIIISVAVVPVTVVVTLYRKSLRRAGAETGLVAIAEERVGAQFDNVRFPQPLVRVAAYEDFIVVAGVNLVTETYDALSGVEIRHAPLEKFDAKLRFKEHTVTMTLPKNSVVLDLLRRKLSVQAWKA